MVWIYSLLFGAIFVWFAIETDRLWKRIVFFILLCGLEPLSLGMAYQDANQTYAAAYRQGIVVTIPFSWNPVVTQPCRLKVEEMGDGDNRKLVLPGTVRVVTPEMLNAICGKKA